MKRPSKSFVVEHKRRARASGGEPPSIWSGAIGSEMRSLVGAAEEEHEAPAQESTRPAKPVSPPQAQAGGRILVAREVAVAAVEEDTREDEETDEDAPAPVPKRGVGRPRRSVASAAPRPTPALPEADAAPTLERDASPASPHAAEAAVPPTAASAQPGAAPLRYSERRRAMTKGLPFGERWKSGL
ncbi:hypothetical protein [Aureimonas sp. AU12]|uniref:hypothetical protein n=1 Tax=Aureimonas sp. AU12 TaxID=1638161 RepID=UPI0007843ABB|nr:hypothetical protein [Aureimonas sp. AU12]